MPTIEAYIFYFDVIGFAAAYHDDSDQAARNLRGFQRQARQAFSFSHDHSYIVTFADSVWCRVNVDEPGCPSLVVDFAGETMRLARKAGFPKYFGVITRGEHAFSLSDRKLVGKESLGDLTEQHIDMMSEPQIRAAFAEKWSKDLAKEGRSPTGSSAVWVSLEVIDESGLRACAELPDAKYSPVGAAFDLSTLTPKQRSGWPFPFGTFHGIVARSTEE